MGFNSGFKGLKSYYHLFKWWQDGLLWNISLWCLILGYDTSFARSVPLTCWYPTDTRISNLIHIFIPNICHRQKMVSNNMTSMWRLILKCQWIYMNSAVKWCWHHKFMFQLMWIIVAFSCKHVNSSIFYMQIYRKFVP